MHAYKHLYIYVEGKKGWNSHYSLITCLCLWKIVEPSPYTSMLFSWKLMLYEPFLPPHTRLWCSTIVLIFLNFILIGSWLLYDIIVVFAKHWHQSAMGLHVFPILNPPPTSLSIPSLRSSQCTSPEHPVSCTKPGLVIYFTYMFQCYSLKWSHPCLLPQSPKNCSIHLCLFCCLAYRVIDTIFLNSIYMQMAPHSSTLA